MALKDVLKYAAIGPIGYAIEQKIKAHKQQMSGAKFYESLMKEIPQQKESEFLRPMIGTAQAALYDNPLAKAAQRERQANVSNMLYAARSGDPQTLAALAAGAYGQGQQQELQAQMADQQLREQRRQAYYGALQTGMQGEQNLFANQLTALQSKASLGGAAYQTRAEAYNKSASDIFKGIGTAVQAAGAVATGNPMMASGALQSLIGGK